VTASLRGIETARLTGGASANRIDAGGFSGSTELTGLAGNDVLIGGTGFDRLVESGDVNFVLTDTSLTGLGADVLSGFEAARLTGGRRNNRLDASGFSGSVQLSGGLGNDTLIGSQEASILLGGAGSDQLTGAAGGDVMIGGNGLDRLVGNGGDDLMINGTVPVYEPNWSALASILAEWDRDDIGLGQRMLNLRNGGGLNGTNRLTVTTIKDDTFSDDLTGGLGADWFWAKVAAVGIDRLLDRDTDDTVG
jgi:Ca2+-binding RTX toxin-like protein